MKSQDLFSPKNKKKYIIYNVVCFKLRVNINTNPCNKAVFFLSASKEICIAIFMLNTPYCTLLNIHSVASNLGLHFLCRPICLNT